jgi:transcriptional regulator NrdR family protein
MLSVVVVAAQIVINASPHERVELVMPVIVKKNGSRTEYESNKLRANFMLALRKRPVSAEAIDSAIQRRRKIALQ